MDDTCKIYGEGKATIEHVMFHCEVVKRIWKMALAKWDGLEQQTGSIKEWWNKLGNATNKKDLSDRFELSTYIMWPIWKKQE